MWMSVAVCGIGVKLYDISVVKYEVPFPSAATLHHTLNDRGGRLYPHGARREAGGVETGHEKRELGRRGVGVVKCGGEGGKVEGCTL